MSPSNRGHRFSQPTCPPFPTSVATTLAATAIATAVTATAKPTPAPASPPLPPTGWRRRVVLLHLCASASAAFERAKPSAACVRNRLRGLVAPAGGTPARLYGARRAHASLPSTADGGGRSLVRRRRLRSVYVTRSRAATSHAASISTVSLVAAAQRSSLRAELDVVRASLASRRPQRECGLRPARRGGGAPLSAMARRNAARGENAAAGRAESGQIGAASSQRAAMPTQRGRRYYVRRALKRRRLGALGRFGRNGGAQCRARGGTRQLYIAAPCNAQRAAVLGA